MEVIPVRGKVRVLLFLFLVGDMTSHVLKVSKVSVVKRRRRKKNKQGGALINEVY